MSAAPSGVWVKTFSSRTSAHAARSSADTWTRAGPAGTVTLITRSWSSASGRQKATRSAITAVASHALLGC